MARSIVVSLDGEESTFGFTKVEREKLYGRKQRVVVDEQSRTCQAAWLTADGTALVPTGGTANVWVDETWNAVEQDARAAVDEAGTALETKPSTLGASQVGTSVDPKRVLDHVIVSVYELAPESLGATLEAALAKGAIIEIPFRYRDGYDDDVMFLLKNDEAMFALVGEPTGFGMLAREQVVPTLDATGEESDELSDDLDFSMM